MKSFEIQGKTTYQALGPGCWGIVTADGTAYRPVNFPEEWKEEGKEVRVWVEPVEEGASVFMWGQAVRIVGR